MCFYTTRSRGDRPAPDPAKDSQPGVALCPPGFQPGAPVPLLSSMWTQFGVWMVLAGLSPPGGGKPSSGASYGTLASGTLISESSFADSGEGRRGHFAGHPCRAEL